VVKYGYRLRLRAAPFTAVPERPGDTGRHGFCGDSTVASATRMAAPSLQSSPACAPSCRDFPKDRSLLRPPVLSVEERTALAAALDSGRLFADQPAVSERVRALLNSITPPARPSGRAHAHSVSALAFTPDGAALITACSEDSRVTLWSVSSRQPLPR
jgi:hypothetical protein